MCQQIEREYVVINLSREAEIATRVRIAGTSEVRRKGLLGANGLAMDSGLWIAPCEAIHTFGMKMPIDAIFLDEHFCVTKIAQVLRPWRLAVCMRAASVLELEMGTIARTQTAVGDRLVFRAEAAIRERETVADKVL